MASLRDHARAAAILSVMAATAVLGTPGLDAVGGAALSGAAAEARYLRQMPAWTLPIAKGVVAFNREVRQPVVRALEPLQRPLRVNQNWSLYLDGPTHCQRLEVRVDDRPIYRSGDRALRWREGFFRAPPVRPIVDGTAGKPQGGGNWRGLMRLVVARVRADFPEAQEVVLRAMWGDWGACGAEEHHRFVARAPDWEAVRP